MTEPKGITLYGEKDDIREMADRLQKMMPGTTKFTPIEAMTVAQVAIAHGLDPFTGEVWGLKSRDGVWYGCMIGIAGRRKKAREQISRDGGVFWMEAPMPVDPAKYSQKADAVVYEIILRDTVSTQAYSQALHSLTNSGIPYREAIEMMGKPPYWIGVGIATPGEQSKMGIHARAKKRAEADVLKQRFDIHLAGIDFSEGDLLPSGVVVPDYIDVPVTTHNGKSDNQLLTELGVTEPGNNGWNTKLFDQNQEEETEKQPETQLEQPKPSGKKITPEMQQKYRELTQKAADLGLVDSFPDGTVKLVMPTDYDTLVKSGKDLRQMIAEYETARMNAQTEEG